MTRTLIVNADDFGRAPGINRGIARTHDAGIVTSASLMVRWPAAEEAARLAAERPRLGLGLHLDVGEWAMRNWEWVPTYEVVDLDDEQAVEREARAQLARFRELVGGDPDHLDSHQHVHREGIPRAVAMRVAAELAVPLREFGDIVYRGDFFGQTTEGDPYPEGIAVDGLVEVLRDLPEGVTEMACHPGEDASEDPLYGSERPREVEVLCDPRVRRAIVEHGIVLASFAELPQRSPG